MQKTYILLLLVLTLFSSCIEDREFDDLDTTIDDPDYELIHYWNFNNTASVNSLITPTITSGGASLDYFGNYIDDVSEGSELNARNDDEPGSALRLRNPSGDFIISIPTTGYRDVILTYATTRTNNGPQEQSISYTLDGINYTSEGLNNTQYGVTTNFIVQQFNFTDIDGADNNPDFKIKISYNINHDLESGNSRYDNITLDGIPTNGGNPDPEPDPEWSVFHYWNFNDAANTTTLITPNIGNGSIEYFGSYYDEVEGTTLNALDGDPAGTALRLRNPSGDLILSLPTTGYRDIVIKYAATRTNVGSQTQKVYYSVDGTNFIDSGLTLSVTPDYTLLELDFTSIAEVNDNDNFKVKIEFDTASQSAPSGNNRIDNLTVEGYTF